MLVIFLLAALGPSIPQVDVNKIRMSASNPSPRIGRRRREVASVMRRRRGIKSWFLAPQPVPGDRQNA